MARYSSQSGVDGQLRLFEICDCCQMDVDYVRGSIWHRGDMICKECFREWYDGDRPTMGTDNSDKVAIGNWVRKKHGLGPLG